MRRQLQIRNGVAMCEWQGTGEMPVPPKGDESVIFVDVTDRPDAQLLHAYDAETDTFTPPPPPPDYGQAVDAREFMMLFTAAERKTIRRSAQSDEDIADFMALVGVPVAIRLKHPTTLAGLAALVAKGLLTAPRAIEIQNRRTPQ